MWSVFFVAAVPNFYFSNLDHIFFLAAIFEISHLSDFGHSFCLHLLIEVLNCLFSEGILINVDGEDIRVHLL